MSGGSFNYLYTKDARDWVETFQDSSNTDAGSMAEALVALGAPEMTWALATSALTTRLSPSMGHGASPRSSTTS